MNRAFFDSVRASPFSGSLSQDQVDGLNEIAHAWDKHGDGDIRKLAYIFATAYHETARTMQPVRETLADNDAQAINRLENAWNAGQLKWVSKPYWRDGWFGRGFIQITHLENYRKAGNELGLNLVANPSLAMDPRIAAEIIVCGMMQGWFTGKSLGDYLTPDKMDFYNARRVVNGTDRADQIANYAKDFLNALRKLPEGKPVSDWREPTTPVPPEKPVEVERVNGAKAGGIFAIIAAILAAAAAYFGMR